MKTKGTLFTALLLALFCAGALSGRSAGFVPVKATYNGLFFETNGGWGQSSGILTLRSTASGKYSALLQLGRARYSFSGQFTATGELSRDVLRRYDQPLHLELQVAPDDPDLLAGTVSTPDWTAELYADRAVFDGRNIQSSDQGRYTMVLFGDFTSTNSPGGESFGTLRVDKTGRLSFSGSLADGTKVTQSATVSKGGQWPFYAPLYRGWGSLYGWVLLNGSADEELSGDVTWIRPQMQWTWYYPEGFAVVTTAQGSRYARPPRGTPILELTTAEVQFNGGNLEQSITNRVILDSNSRVQNQEANGLRLSFSMSDGSFSGRVMHPITWEWIPFRGVVLQKYGVAAGYFPGWDQTGEVWLEGR